MDAGTQSTAQWLPCLYVIVLEDRGGGYIIAQTSPDAGFTIVHVDGSTGVLRQWPRSDKDFSSLADAETEIGFPGLLTNPPIQSMMQKAGSSGFMKQKSSGDNLYQQGTAPAIRFNSFSSVSANASPKRVIRGLVCLGYTVIGRTGLLLIAKSAKSQFDLPTGHPLIVIKEADWVQFSLHSPLPTGQTQNEVKNINGLIELPIDNLHFFSTQNDLSVPLCLQAEWKCSESSSEGIIPKRPTFVWNNWLREPFLAAGVLELCPPLQQGFADTRELSDLSGRKFAISLIAKRSSLHTGTRYLARGLNFLNEPGNEVECEQIVWKLEERDAEWSSFLFRRGTVPIRWGQDLKRGGVGEAEIYIKDDYSEGTAEYFNRIARDLQVNQIRCVNLLKCAPGKPETTLSECFQEAVRKLNKSSDFEADVHIVNFDWHTNRKKLGEVGALEGLWENLESTVKDSGLWLSSGGRRQTGILRYNCADSLDRTNLASYFVCAQVLMEQCAILNIVVTYGTSKDEVHALPSNWDYVDDPIRNRRSYYDRVNQLQYWVHPEWEQLNRSRAKEPFADYVTSLQELKDKLYEIAINSLASLYQANGDVQANLYTGSKAMHSDAINLLKMSYGSKGTSNRKLDTKNMGITIQRRYLNIFNDASRQQYLEEFIGLHRRRYFPSLDYNLNKPDAMHVISLQATLLKPLPGGPLTHKKWLLPRDNDMFEIYLVLPYPARIHGILVFPSPVDPTSLTSPKIVEIRAGPYMDNLRVLANSLTLPRGADGQPLLYELPRTNPSEPQVKRWGEGGHLRFSYSVFGYDHDHFGLSEKIDDVSYMDRVVLISCRNTGSLMCVGQIELLGETCVFSGQSQDEGSKDLQEMLMHLDLSGSHSYREDKQQDFSQVKENDSGDPKKTRESHKKAYEEAVKKELGSKTGTIDLSTALKLETERVQIGLTLADRGKVEYDLRQSNAGVLDPLKQISPNFSLNLRNTQYKVVTESPPSERERNGTPIHPISKSSSAQGPPPQSSSAISSKGRSDNLSSNSWTSHVKRLEDLVEGYVGKVRLNSIREKHRALQLFQSLLKKHSTDEDSFEDFLKEISLKDSLVSLASFPYAALLYSLPNLDQQGEILLTGLSTDLSKQWIAPPNETKISIPIVLPRNSRLSSIVLLSEIDAQGELDSNADADVCLSVGMTISDRKEIDQRRLSSCRRCNVKRASHLWAYVWELEEEAICRLIFLDITRISDKTLSLTRILALGSEIGDPYECELGKIPAIDASSINTLSKEMSIFQRNRVPVSSEDIVPGGVELRLQAETLVSGFRMDSYVSSPRVSAASRALGAAGIEDVPVTRQLPFSVRCRNERLLSEFGWESNQLNPVIFVWKCKLQGGSRVYEYITAITVPVTENGINLFFDFPKREKVESLRFQVVGRSPMLIDMMDGRFRTTEKSDDDRRRFRQNLGELIGAEHSLVGRITPYQYVHSSM